MGWQTRRRPTRFWDNHIKDLEFTFVPSLPRYWRDIPEKNLSFKEDARRR
jgi:hypothetical protein